MTVATGEIGYHYYMYNLYYCYYCYYHYYACYYHYHYYYHHYCYLLRREKRVGLRQLRLERGTTFRAIHTTPNLPTNIMDFRGFDSSIILIYRVGILMSIGNLPESLSQAMLVGIMLVGRLDVVVILQRKGGLRIAEGGLYMDYKHRQY